MNNPRCPYCGEEMIPVAYGTTSLKRMNADWVFHNRSEQDTRYCFQCSICEAESPLADTYEEAYAAAMKRERVKGEWIYKNRHEHYPSGKPYTSRYCGVCGRRDHNEDSDYCGYCGADMRKGKNDER